MADGAVYDRQCPRAFDAAARAGAGCVVADGAVNDPQRGTGGVADASARAGRAVAASVVAHCAVGDRQRAKVADASAEGGCSIHDGQAGDGDIGARVDPKYAKGRRADIRAALKRRSVALDSQLMTSVAADHRQAVLEIVERRESVSAIGRQLDCVVLAVRVGRGDVRD